MRDSSLLKAEYLANYQRDDSVLILIDDDPQNLKDVRRLNEDIFFFLNFIFFSLNILLEWMIHFLYVPHNL